MGRKKVPDDHPLKAVRRQLTYENGTRVLRHQTWQSFVNGLYRNQSIRSIMANDPGYVMDLVDKGMIDLSPGDLTYLEQSSKYMLAGMCKTSDLDSYTIETE